MFLLSVWEKYESKYKGLHCPECEAQISEKLVNDYDMFTCPKCDTRIEVVNRDTEHLISIKDFSNKPISQCLQCERLITEEMAIQDVFYCVCGAQLLVVSRDPFEIATYL